MSSEPKTGKSQRSTRHAHQIACIGALIAERRDGVWQVVSLGAPHMGERTESEMLQSFVGRIAEFRPQMITFNGSSFDLPILRCRAMINRVSAPGLECRRYWCRYSDDPFREHPRLTFSDGTVSMTRFISGTRRGRIF